MRAIAHERRRFGYRRVHVLLKREGYRVNHKKLFRLYREEKLAVRRRGARKRAIGTMAPNDHWSLDFVSDQLTCGRRLRILTVVDDCTRECMALVADTSRSSASAWAPPPNPTAGTNPGLDKTWGQGQPDLYLAFRAYCGKLEMAR
jgi:putative transposase